LVATMQRLYVSWTKTQPPPSFNLTSYTHPRQPSTSSSEDNGDHDHRPTSRKTARRLPPDSGPVREGQNSAEPTRSPASNPSIAATPELERDDAGGMSHSSSEDLHERVEEGPVDLTNVMKWACLTSDAAASGGGWESNLVNDGQLCAGVRTPVTAYSQCSHND
jgi:hypothetical protein